MDKGFTPDLPFDIIKEQQKQRIKRHNGKQASYMPVEKEINCNLFERLDLLDSLERVEKQAECEPVLKEIDFERKLIERRLYQQPPLMKE